MSFAKNIGNNIGKSLSKNLGVKYGERRFDHAKESAADAFKIVSKRATQNIAEATGDMIGNKNTGTITNVTKNS